jgi:hypothetical protein
MEFAEIKIDLKGHDVLLNAGDTHPNPGVRHRMHEYFNVNVMGNHDYYGGDFPEEHHDRGMYTSGGLLFAYATLWTKLTPEQFERYTRSLVDDRWIRGITYEKYDQKFESDLDYLRNSCADVVVTHHSPFYASIGDEFRDADLNYCFHSDLEEDVFSSFKIVPRLWVHGHTHTPCDYVLRDRLRVVCHPRGYPGEKNHEGYSVKAVEL